MGECFEHKPLGASTASMWGGPGSLQCSAEDFNGASDVVVDAGGAKGCAATAALLTAAVNEYQGPGVAVDGADRFRCFFAAVVTPTAVCKKLVAQAAAMAEAVARNGFSGCLVTTPTTSPSTTPTTTTSATSTPTTSTTVTTSQTTTTTPTSTSTATSTPTTSTTVTSTVTTTTSPTSSATSTPHDSLPDLQCGGGGGDSSSSSSRRVLAGSSSGSGVVDAFYLNRLLAACNQPGRVKCHGDGCGASGGKADALIAFKSGASCAAVAEGLNIIIDEVLGPVTSAKQKQRAHNVSCMDSSDGANVQLLAEVDAEACNGASAALNLAIGLYTDGAFRTCQKTTVTTSPTT